jgi:hypothetical protein
MEPVIGEAPSANPPDTMRPTWGFAFTAALATFWVSAAIGCVAITWSPAFFERTD